MKNAILVLLLIVGCSGISTPNKSDLVTLPEKGQIDIIHLDDNFIIYGKTIHIGNSYTSHVVWSVDSAGNITHLATH